MKAKSPVKNTSSKYVSKKDELKLKSKVYKDAMADLAEDKEGHMTL
jgi:hypothetical protein